MILILDHRSSMLVGATRRSRIINCRKPRFTGKGADREYRIILNNQPSPVYYSL
jgi:hypothetical protein